MTDEIFDFGFTAVNENELEAVQSAAANQEELQKLKVKTDRLYKSILPLLANLKKNSEKDYIYWPNRIEKITEFETKLTQIYND